MSIVVSTAATTGPSPMKKKKREGSGHWLATIVRHILFLHRRRQLFPLISAASGCLLLLFVAFSIFSTPPAIHHLQRHPPLNHKLAVESNFDLYASFHVPESGGSLGRELWTSRESKFYFGCCSASNTFQTADVKTHPNRYLLIATSGGLNQQRTGITDAVVAAYILNATLVIPTLDHKSYWKDSSDFEEIFDVDWFISFLSRDVKVIKELPSSPGKISHMRVPRKCNPKCYESRVLPVLKKKHAVQLTKYDYRLSNKLDDELQKLRCRVNYHALKFTDSLNKMGKTLVERMRMKAKHYIALHLRFEPDMLAFSGCYYGGGDKEREELGEIRKRWKTLHVSNPDKVRRRGKCPLTPQEIGLMLRALGFGSDVHLYVASGEVYGGEATLAPLKELFPNFHSKETLTSKKELKLFSSFSSRMAALDFMVCDESDVFVTNNNGNMARILAGRRRYFGHKPTIRPNAKKISRLLMDRNNMTWEEFASRVRTHQIGFMGEPNEVKAGRGEFHENPTSCICESALLKARNQSLEHRKMGEKHKQTKDTGNVANDQLPEDDPDWPDDYEDNSYEGEELPVEPHLTQSLSVKPEHSDMDDMFSD